LRTITFDEAIEEVLAQAMADDPRIIIFGEDVQMSRVNLYAQFGERRIRDTPISESAFLGAAITAAMAGLRPVVEVMLIDFIGVAMDALLNHASKLEAFSGGTWKAPFVLRTACGGGLGDGGQHQQALWGWLSHIPGLTVVVPSTPADAGGLLLSSLQHDGPVIYMEHKLLSDFWVESLGHLGRDTVDFDRPLAGMRGTVPETWEPIPFGQAVSVRSGVDLTIISVGVGVHRSLEAAAILEEEGIGTGVIDLRTISPLDTEAICEAVSNTGRMLVVDEDYQGFGLSGELAAVVLEAGIEVKYGRVCTEKTIPYSQELEAQTLPNKERIVEGAVELMDRS
jgi:pyruvate dehydrogenase E1 component beta subunit